jgi:hypothetical protein
MQANELKNICHLPTNEEKQKSRKEKKKKTK